MAHNSYEYHERGGWQFLGVDQEADKRLRSEIKDIAQRGYDISVGFTPDPAYEEPERIGSMYSYLNDLDQHLVSEARTRRLGLIGLNPLKWSERRLRDKDRQLEPIRVRELFEPVGAVAWHEQRGRATALLSIEGAHDLMVNHDRSTGIYPAIGAILDPRVSGYTFGDQAGWMNGLSLHEALVAGELRVSRRTPEQAEAHSQRRIAKLDTFTHAPVTQEFKDIVQYCVDSLGIRARKLEVHEAIKSHLQTREHLAAEPLHILSFGSGTALPMLELVHELSTQWGIDVKLILLDQDPVALAAAGTIAEDMGLGNLIEIHCQPLFRAWGKPIALDSILNGRKLDVIEDSGLREYLPDRMYRWLTSESWEALKPGGLMTTGNMNTNRPQAEFLHGMMGWFPAVQMRTIEEGLRLHEQAGISREHTRVRVTREGVYSMYFTTKPS